MSEAFADTFYWIALTDPRDPWHQRAAVVGRTVGVSRLVTTEPILLEVLNFFAGAGPFWRTRAIRQVQSILHNDQVEVLPYRDDTLVRGMEFYADRQDKGYSLTDCISMREMRERAIYEVLTHDIHFEQEGFVLLLRD